MTEERNEWKVELLSKNELDLQIWKILSISISQKSEKACSGKNTVWPSDHWISKC